MHRFIFNGGQVNQSSVKTFEPNNNFANFSISERLLGPNRANFYLLWSFNFTISRNFHTSKWLRQEDMLGDFQVWQLMRYFYNFRRPVCVICFSQRTSLFLSQQVPKLLSCKSRHYRYKHLVYDSWPNTCLIIFGN